MVERDGMDYVLLSNHSDVRDGLNDMLEAAIGPHALVNIELSKIIWEGY